MEYERPIITEKDDILQELWDAKDYYSLSCNSKFEELVRRVREDIKDLVADSKQDEPSKAVPYSDEFGR